MQEFWKDSSSSNHILIARVSDITIALNEGIFLLPSFKNGRWYQLQLTNEMKNIVQT